MEDFSIELVSCRITTHNLSKVYEASNVPLPLGVARLAALAGVRMPASTTSRGKVALRDVSVDIREGERVGIIGENGAGKSTLLHILAGVASPTEGALEIVGRIHAVLTLGLGLREDLTGRENLYLDSEIQGRSRADLSGIIDEMIAFTELGESIDRPVRTYSSGMKSRLAFTSLAFTEPEILLIDEALSVGDQWFRQKATLSIRRLCERGRIVLLVSHSLGSIVEMCSRCIWLGRGQVIADGPPGEVTEAYRTSIHRRDEEELAQKFSESAGAWSKTPHCNITDMILYGAASSAASIFRLGEPMRVHMAVRLEPVIQMIDMCFWIERFDGLRVTESWLSERMPPSGKLLQDRWIQVEVDPLTLKPGLYKAHGEVWNGGEPVAGYSSLFKIIADTRLVGGEPALRASFDVKCRPVLELPS